MAAQQQVVNNGSVLDEYNKIIAWQVEQQRNQALMAQAREMQLQAVISGLQARIKDLEDKLPKAAPEKASVERELS